MLVAYNERLSELRPAVSSRYRHPRHVDLCIMNRYDFVLIVVDCTHP